MKVLNEAIKLEFLKEEFVKELVNNLDEAVTPQGLDKILQKYASQYQNNPKAKDEFMKHALSVLGKNTKLDDKGFESELNKSYSIGTTAKGAPLPPETKAKTAADEKPANKPGIMQKVGQAAQKIGAAVKTGAEKVGQAAQKGATAVKQAQQKRAGMKTLKAIGDKSREQQNQKFQQPEPKPEFEPLPMPKLSDIGKETPPPLPKKGEKPTGLDLPDIVPQKEDPFASEPTWDPLPNQDTEKTEPETNKDTEKKDEPKEPEMPKMADVAKGEEPKKEKQKEKEQSSDKKTGKNKEANPYAALEDPEYWKEIPKEKKTKKKDTDKEKQTSKDMPALKDLTPKQKEKQRRKELSKEAEPKKEKQPSGNKESGVVIPPPLDPVKSQRSAIRKKADPFYSKWQHKKEGDRVNLGHFGTGGESMGGEIIKKVGNRTYIKADNGKEYYHDDTGFHSLEKKTGK